MDKDTVIGMIDKMYNPDGKDRLIYQSIDIGDIHIVGRRGRKRIELMGNSSLKGKSVIDCGCSYGMFCFDAKDRGADYVLGVDNCCQHGGGDIIDVCRALAEYGGYDIDFQKLTVNSDEFYEYVSGRQFDIAYVFAIIEHITNIDRFWEWINKSVKMMYFDSNISKGRDIIEPILRNNVNFKYIDYLGESADTDLVPSHRVFYKCHNEHHKGDW